MSKKVIIVGAGITGLASAWYLEKLGINDITILESQKRIGGKIKTTREDGYIVESGADSFITTKPYALNLIKDLGIESELISPKTSKFYFLKDGKLIDSPNGLKMMTVINKEAFLANKLFTEEGKARIMNESKIAPLPSTEDESLGSFVRRRLGDEMLENYVEPLFGGIYATPVDELSMEASFPMFKMMEVKYGSLTNAALAQANQVGENANRSGFMSLKNGVQTLIDTLVSKLKNTKIIFNSNVSQIYKEDTNKYRIDTSDNSYFATDIILTLSPLKIPEILKFKNDRLPEIFKEFSFSSSHIATLAYPKAVVGHDMQATGYVVPLNEDTKVTASTWSSGKWPNRTPENHVLIRCFFDQEQNNKSDEDLVALAHQTMINLLNISADYPEKYWISHYAHSLPQYKVGHYNKLGKLRDQLKVEFPDILLAGAPYEGVGIPDCIKQGKNAAQIINDR